MLFGVFGAAIAVTLTATGAALAQDAPATAEAGDLTVSQATMMGWNSSHTGLGGEVSFTVRNLGEADRVVSVNSPAGPPGEVSVQVARNGQAIRLEPGDASVAAAVDGQPGLSRVTAQLTGLAHGRPSSVPTTVTVTFERAGQVTVSATPVSPAPPPAQ
ncbi:hypothetical protein GGQ87_001022 [Brevundimonas alba]|uniref:Copper chaperone PCu(A)C n=1 Tax=Brevundimonas alba TaxID=74314 RepID=A0A7X5YLB7_9CAUL|nr:hypothetical protein [Brevundimonas alba]NJC40764.1 hypothetical protein [Brevundimonas alba]